MLFISLSKSLRILLFFVILFTLNSCNGQQKKENNQPLRDTSITVETAYSKLFLDSLVVEQFIKQEMIENKTAAEIRKFYLGRNYEYAWFNENGTAEHTYAFWNLHNNFIDDFSDTTFKHKPIHHEINTLLQNDAPQKPAPLIPKAELQITMHFFEYIMKAYSGNVDISLLRWYIPKKKIDQAVLLDSFIARKGQNLPDWEPVNIYYQHLKTKLLHYSAIDKKGGWQTILADRKITIKPGDSSLIIKQIKNRLRISGENSNVDTTHFYSDYLIPIIKLKQKNFGMKEDGFITNALLLKLNVSVQERIKQILLNLERMRWIPQKPEPNIIVVNIPEFKLHVFEASKKLFSMNIVVGKAANNTVIFTDQLQFVVFSPYWNIPSSIVKNEIEPAIRRNRNYLSKMNMERSAGGYRQKPGGSNALGKVKFIFPNNYNIYFHDTPSKSLFQQESRAFSHGCIRLAEPQKMAAYLLRDQPLWTTEKITEAMNSSTEKWVPLTKEIPVFISYFTAWVDSEGQLNFRDDIYDHDKRLAKQLFK